MTNKTRLDELRSEALRQMKRKRKEKRYEEMGIRLLSLEPDDDQRDIFMDKILDEIGMNSPN